MSWRMYQTGNNNRLYFMLFVMGVITVGYFTYTWTRPLVVEAECSEIALKTSGLTKSFNYDPLDDYDLNKTECISNSLDVKTD